MTRASRPGRVNKEIVNVLLRIIDDSLHVMNRFVNELPQSGGVLNSEAFVARSNCRFQILAQKPNDAFLVGVGHGHAVFLTTGHCSTGLALRNDFRGHPRFHLNGEMP